MTCPHCTDADTDNPLVLKLRIAALRADLAAARGLLQDVLNECACKGRIVGAALVDRIDAALAGKGE